MATNISLSPQKAQEIMKKADAAMAKLTKIRSKTEEKVGEFFKLTETVGGAVAVGLARAKWGEVTIGPEIPVDALVGAGLSLAAFLDLPGKHSEHLHNIGNGILGGFASLEAVKLTGGIVLSKSEYQSLVHNAQQTQPASLPQTTVKESVQGEVRTEQRGNMLPPANGHSARESFAQTEAQGQEAAARKRVVES